MPSLTKPIPLNWRAVRTMQANRRKDTAPELAVRKCLRAKGLVGYRIDVRQIGRPDIAFPGMKVAIFVHGCFWHGCPRCKPRIPVNNAEYWRAKRYANKLRDRHAVRSLRNKGWSVFTLWECAISRDANSATRAAIASIKKRR